MYNLQPYERKVFYYETDRMGIVHHSNYIRWFEESRIWNMQQMGLTYEEMEQNGILMPVLSVSATYRKHLTFGDRIRVRSWMYRYNGIKFYCKYTVRNAETGELCVTGETSHCILNRELKPFRFAKSFPEYDRMLRESLEEEDPANS